MLHVSMEPEAPAFTRTGKKTKGQTHPKYSFASLGCRNRLYDSWDLPSLTRRWPENIDGCPSPLVTDKN